jgi:hypothetical protein
LIHFYAPVRWDEVTIRLYQCNFLKEAAYIIKEAKMTTRKSVPFLLWPFYAIWRLLALILEITGRLVGAILGLVLMILGVILTITVVGAIIGVPLIVFGLMLSIRSLF